MALKTQRLNELLANDGDAYVCGDISNEACREVPNNVFLILVSQFFTKLGDALASTKVVLPWVLQSLSIPTFFIGLLVSTGSRGH